jgi:hypothetical protein
VDAQVQSHCSPYGICGGQLALGLAFCQALEFSFASYHSTSAPYESVICDWYSRPRIQGNQSHSTAVN